MRLRILALVWAFSAFGISAAWSDEKGRVTVSLYLGKNAPPPAEVQLAPAELSEQLREVFGFNHYVLIKSEEVELGKEWEQWVVPRNDFFIRVIPLHYQPGLPRMVDYEIYDDGFIVAKGQFEPSQDTPLFINGPDFKRGRFIFVLQAW